MLFGNLANIESLVAFDRECISVEGYQRVFRFVLFEGIVECEKAGEVCGIRDESGPDFEELARA